jgi:hypothetical protein
MSLANNPDSPQRSPPHGRRRGSSPSAPPAPEALRRMLETRRSLPEGRGRSPAPQPPLRATFPDFRATLEEAASQEVDPAAAATGAARTVTSPAAPAFAAASQAVSVAGRESGADGRGTGFHADRSRALHRCVATQDCNAKTHEPSPQLRSRSKGVILRSGCSCWKSRACSSRLARQASGLEPGFGPFPFQTPRPHQPTR